MRPEYYVAILLRRWWLPVLGGLLAAAVAYLIADQQPRVYEATTRVMAIAAPDKADQYYWLDLYAKNRLESYRQIAASGAMADQAVEKGRLPWSAGELLARVATRHNPSENTVTLGVRDGDPALAAQAANALAEVVVACLNSADCALTPAAPPVKIVRLDQAGPPSDPIGTRPRLTAAGGGVLGVVVGLLIAVLVEYLDDVLRTPHDLRRALGGVVVGRVPAGGRRSAAAGAGQGGAMAGTAGPLVMVNDPASARAEAYRLLRANLLAGAAAAIPRSVLVVGIGRDSAGEVAANLAAAAASAGTRTLLVDANLRTPSLHTLFGLPNEAGLSAGLAGGTSSPVATGVDNLSLLPAGDAMVGAAEALGGDRFKQLLAGWCGAHDLVVLEAPPVGALADAPVLATRVDGVVLVVRAGQTRRAGATEAKETLERLGARVLGVALIER